MKRVFQPEEINQILNHPSVLSAICVSDAQKIDVSEIVDNKDNWCFCQDGCAFIAHKVSAGMYECHTAALPSSWGRKCADMARSALDVMREESDAVFMFGWTPVANRAANHFNRLMGATKIMTKNLKRVGSDKNEMLNLWEIK